jgi:SAM-dependent methyltransferase
MGRPEMPVREPPTAPDDVLNEQDVEFHRATAGEYDESITATYRIYHEYELLPLLDQLGPERVRALDVGCGTGAVALELAMRGHETLGLDHSPEMLEIARNRAQALGVEASLELRQADVRRLPIDDDQFDFVAAQGVLHHLPRPEVCLSEIARVLRPGGTFFISEPCLPAPSIVRIWEALIRIAKAVRRRLGTRPEHKHAGLAPGEGPISAAGLCNALDSLGLQYQARYLSHLQLLERLLPDRARLAVIRLISAPWRRRRGSLIFVTGRKPVSKP